MNRKQIIDHFRDLAEMAGHPLKTEPTRKGVRLIFDGHKAVLPKRKKIRCVGYFERKLGLRPHDFSRA